MLRKSLVFFLILILSGLPQAFTHADSSPEDFERIYLQTFQKTAPTDSLSTNLTPEFQQSIGLEEGDIRTFVQESQVKINGKSYPATTEYIQGHVTAEQLVDVLSEMQNDLLKIFLQNPKLKFKVKYLEKHREVSKELPVTFFLNLLREADKINYEKIKMDPLLAQALETDKRFQNYINSTFDESQKLLDDGELIPNFTTKTRSDKKTRIWFALIRFSGIIAVPLTAAYLVPAALGILVTDVPNLNVFLTTQLFLGTASMGIQLYIKTFGKWLGSGWPNFNGYKYGNSKVLEYTRWWLLEGAFLAIIPGIQAFMGVYPEVSWAEYTYKALFHTALLSTATQGLWDVYFNDKFDREIKEARIQDALIRAAKLKTLGTKIFDMTEDEVARELKANEFRVINAYNRNMAFNSIVSVSLGSIQMTAVAMNVHDVVTATFIGYGLYGITALYKIARERMKEHRAPQDLHYISTLGLTKRFLSGEISEELLKDSLKKTASTGKSAKKFLHNTVRNKHDIELEKREELRRSYIITHPGQPVPPSYSCQLLFGH